ncbi:hypothetical protein AB6870_21700 [Rahnella inusitata]|uniref:hypothetical protein n=1 Tax=Rahnella inusitata TaxID=58169 RepID=UPI0039BEBC1D
MKRFIIIISILFSFSALSASEKQIGCFSSDSKSINVKLIDIYDDGTHLGYVKYKNSKESIPLLFSGEKSESVGEDRPIENTTNWLEFIHGKYNGQYIVMSQGARYYQFIYKSISGKTISLNENLEAYNDDRSDCIW